MLDWADGARAARMKKNPARMKRTGALRVLRLISMRRLDLNKIFANGAETRGSKAHEWKTRGGMALRQSP